MSKKEDFLNYMTQGYACKGDFIVLGGAKLDGEAVADAHIRIPLKTLNRHGLIAGATGTGKTKSLQVITEQLSLKGIPSLVMDVKGDLRTECVLELRSRNSDRCSSPEYST